MNPHQLVRADHTYLFPPFYYILLAVILFVTSLIDISFFLPLMSFQVFLYLFSFPQQFNLNQHTFSHLLINLSSLQITKLSPATSRHGLKSLENLRQHNQTNRRVCCLKERGTKEIRNKEEQLGSKKNQEEQEEEQNVWR